MASDAAAIIDETGIAVVTGGASGFGLAAATRFVLRGMAVAILDVSAAELEAAAKLLREKAKDLKQVLAVKCDVSKFADCEAAQAEIAKAFPDRQVSFLFNNAGISGTDQGSIIKSKPESWQGVFGVNVFGAVNIFKAFLPSMIKGGPLKSGKKSFVVTTSSIVGLVHSNLGVYGCSKIAVTAACEQLSIELEGMGSRAAHISPHILFPSVGATGFFNMRGADGSKGLPDMLKKQIGKVGGFSAESMMEAMFEGVASGKHYIAIDHELDIPVVNQVQARMEDQISGRRPRKAAELGVMLGLQNPKALEERKAVVASIRSKM